MPDRPRDPFTGTDRLLIDGSNLLHALRRAETGGPGASPPAALIGRLRAAVPPNVGVELVLDGAPERGMRNARIAAGLIVRHSGRRTGDQLIMDLVEDARRSGDGAGPDRRTVVDNLLVVTDDRQLRGALRDWGVRTAGTEWLIGRLERPRLESPSTGNRRPPRALGAARAAAGGGPADGDEEANDRPGWNPGRGATRKRGNPKRGHPA